MEITTTRRIAQAFMGGLLATAIIAGGTASADRGGFTTVPEKPIEEHVLTVLRDDSRDSRLGLKVAGTDDGRTAIPGSFQIGTPSTNSGFGGPGDYKAGPGCSIQCITSGVAYARGPNAKLVVKTDTEARIWIHVQGPNGYYRVQDSGATEVMEFGALFDDLHAGTTYQAWAVAKDKQNYEATRSGSFTTLVRNVEIAFTHADLIDRAYNSSEFKKQVWMNGGWDDDHTAHGLIAENNDVLLGINFIKYTDVDRYMDFAIQLTEYTSTCNNLGYPDQTYHGPGSCSFLSFAKLLEGQNDLDARPADATSWTEWTLQRTLERPSGLWPLYDDELRFTVPVSIKVTYVPWDF